jgi:hypothetical protein
MTADLQISLEQQILELEAELTVQQSDVENLQGALAAIENNQPRPARPQEDSIFNLLRESLEAVPANLEAQRVHQEKLAAVQRTLEQALVSVEQKQRLLAGLRQQQREQQQAAAFEELKSKAAAFNSLIDSAMVELEAMRSLSKVAGSGRFEIVADMNETPFCHITANSVKLRRRFDVLRG